ncbi:MAG: gamma-glutamyltransferase 1 [Acidobacteriaceae bacterium]|nr:gamma-glutamyltransferase 1 [Acidobacteriaceae bacterium]
MKIHRKLLILLYFGVTVTALPTRVAAAPLKPTHAEKAIVVSVHEVASKAGVEMLRAGGNAVDAAVATGFALAVVHPQAGNIGGGGFMLVRMASGATHFLDYREKAPAAATRDMYLDAKGNVVKDLSMIGYKAIGVPGSVAGLVMAQKKWGKLKLERVMQPAILLAKTGFTLAYEDAQNFKDAHLSEFPASRRTFQRNGDFYRPGESFRQMELAKTLERIAADPNSFYTGALAHELAEAVRKGGGLITEKDLADYEVKEREVVRGTYRGYEIIGAPPPSSGGIALIEALNILEGYDLRSMGSRSADSIHVTAEAFRRVMYDRADFLGDPDFAKIPVPELLDKQYAAAWRESINPEKASVSRQLQRPAFRNLDQVAWINPATQQAITEPENTTHYSVVDAAGNAVSVSTTLNDSFGSHVSAEGLGFLLNDEMDDFVSKQGVPNAYGLIQGPANAIEGGKRPLSAMAPTIVLKDGKLFMVLGSPGGPRIITTVANILMGVIDYGLSIQEAVNAPRFHHQWLPDSISMEKVGFSPDTIRLLSNRGHKLDFTGYWSDGECIAIDQKTGERLGGTDGRNNGRAVGY